MLSTKQFHWDVKTQTFATEISDIDAPLFTRLYPDACDTGFVLESHKTGAKTTWCFTGSSSKDNEILDWTFRPTNETVRKYPKLEHVRVLVFND